MPAPHDVGGTGLRLSLLGGFELRASRHPVKLPHNAQRVLAFLAVRERPQPRLTVAGSLWLDTTEDRAAANLRTALWKIRQLAGPAVRCGGGSLSLAPELQVDLTWLCTHARQLLHTDALAAEPDERTDLTALAGDLLPDWDEDWIRFERERLRQLRVHALESLCGRLSRSGRHAEAVDAGQLAVAVEPLRESAQRALINAHLAEGNRCEAMRQYAIYRDVLWEALEIRPSEELGALVRATAGRDMTVR